MALRLLFFSPVRSHLKPSNVHATRSDEGKLTFERDAGFYDELRRRVATYFATSGRRPRDDPRMYLKTAILLLWFGTSYALLVFVAATWWQGALLSGSLALAMAGVGFAVQHDANHGAYSKHAAVNRIMRVTLDLLGASSYVWRFKHNVAHHTYTNVTGADDDIDLGWLARLAPTQRRRRAHRIQQFYVWALYSLLIPGYHIVFDFKNLARGRIARSNFPRPRGWNLVELIAGKVVFFAWAIAIPMFFHPWWVVLLFYAGTSLVLGLILSVVFQLAHAVEEADFPSPRPDSNRFEASWAVHQTESTVDFARGSRVLTWLLGGLNYQIEHHLFPRICHIHYPRLAPIVESTCAEFGVRYTVQESLGSALASHWRWLRRLGRAPDRDGEAPKGRRAGG
jgi:linoleoyl-CoA desaturase